jgi:hypothetical protein
MKNFDGIFFLLKMLLHSLGLVLQIYEGRDDQLNYMVIVVNTVVFSEYQMATVRQQFCLSVVSALLC